jgi:hypothetical protein
VFRIKNAASIAGLRMFVAFFKKKSYYESTRGIGMDMDIPTIA